ncbi:MAG: hypothetical protein ACT4O0_03180 [Pseudonocardia sp.]
MRRRNHTIRAHRGSGPTTGWLIVLRAMVRAAVGTILAACALGGLLVVAAPAAHAAGGYDNAAIADKALSYVGRWGGDACRDAQKQEPFPGECRGFVNCIVWMLSARSQNLGGQDYFHPFLAAGGSEIRSLDALRKGDIVQEGQGDHTFIIVGRVGGNTFRVVDSNRSRTEKVATYDRAVVLDGSRRAFRMGKVVDAAPAGQPFGHLDDVRPAAGGVDVAGWAIDPDTDAPIQVHFYGGDGAAKPGVNPGLPLVANASRPDVAKAFPRYSANHGYTAFFALPAGNHTVCAYGIDTAGGHNPRLGCKTVTVDGRPFGHLDDVRPAAGGVDVAGWAIDPDTDAPIQVHFYGGDGAAKPGVNPGLPMVANASRPDVAKAFPRYSANHGYTAFFALPAGNHTVCAYGIDTAGGHNPVLGCKPVTVAAPTPKPFAAADRPAALTMSDRCVRSGPCLISWKQPEFGGGELVHYEVEGARNGRELPVVRVPGTSMQYTDSAFGTCGATVVVVRAVTKHPVTGKHVRGASAMTNTVETGCAPPQASIASARLTEQGERQVIDVTINEPTNGAGTCLIRVNTVARWNGACGRNQSGSPAVKRTVTIPLTDRAATFSLTVTATNAEGSDTSATTTVKNTVASAPKAPVQRPQMLTGKAPDSVGPGLGGKRKADEPGKTGPTNNAETSNDRDDSKGHGTDG